MADYILKCSCAECGAEYADTSSLRLRCDRELNGEHGPALLKPVYEQKRLKVRTDLPGIFMYSDWLPTGSIYVSPDKGHLGQPFCYKSSGLAKRLGLKKLFIAFSGYWTERGASAVSRTFKEFEVQASVANYLNAYKDRGEAPALVISSAGNTGNGFNLLTHQLGMPLYLFIPETGLNNLVLTEKTAPFAVVVKGDYTDAIAMADKVADKVGLIRNGGALNVARRAGMGCVMLHAVAHPEQGRQKMFDHYFQAVGSASGAIAAWEAVQLLLEDGRFGDSPTRIHMAQNVPFTPICDAWEANLPDLIAVREELARERLGAVTATVLTNRNPPYSSAGGIREVLEASAGSTWRVNNFDLFHAARAFRTTEGVDIGPAAAVAVDSLRQAVEAGEVKSGESVLLHITGGGREIQYSEVPVYRVEPTMTVHPSEVEKVVSAIGRPKPVSINSSAIRNYG